MVIGMGKPKIISDVIPQTLSLIDDGVKRKIDEHKIFFKWREFVGEESDKIFPVKIEGKTLTLYSDSPSLKDKFKYRIPQLIQKINAGFDDEVVTKIIFGKSFQAKPPIKQSVTPFEKIPEIILTDEEILECEKKSSAIQNPDRRKMLFDCLIAKKKSDKSKKFSGWHKCAVCENLCRVKENLCDVCKIKERDKMIKTIRKIFHDAPTTKFFDVQRQISELMPHMKAECTLSVIESARMSLIQQTVRRISFNDKESPLVKFLVMLVRQLPAESLTEKIIEKTLHEFRFDFPDRPPFKPQNFKKLSPNVKTFSKRLITVPEDI